MAGVDAEIQAGDEAQQAVDFVLRLDDTADVGVIGNFLLVSVGVGLRGR